MVYKKSFQIKKGSNTLIIKHHFFGIKFTNKIQNIQQINVEHFLSSPNMAKINTNDKTKSFENRGHFILYAILDDNSQVKLDRHTNKVDLIGLMNLINTQLKA